MKLSIPTIKLIQEEWDEACEILKAEYGYTTKAECRKHLQEDVRAYADYLCSRYIENSENYGCL